MIRTLTLLILTAIVMASVACGPPPPAEVIIVTATPPPAPAIPSAQDLKIEQQIAGGFDAGYQQGYGKGHTAGLADGELKSIVMSEKAHKSGYDKGYAEGRKVGQQEGWDAHIAELKNPNKAKVTATYDVDGALDWPDARNLAVIHLQNHYVTEVDGKTKYSAKVSCQLYAQTSFEYYDIPTNMWHFTTSPSTEPRCKRPKVVKVLVNDKTQETSFPPAQDLQQPQQTALLLSNKADALLETGNDSEAIKVYTQAIELWPDYHMYWHRGIAYIKSGNFPAGCKDYQTALNTPGLTDEQKKILKDNLIGC